MSITKIILIVVLVGVIAFVGFLVYVLMPTIKNVSHHKALKKFINQPLTLKRKTSIYFCTPGGYRFKEYVLSEDVPNNSEKKYEIPVGSVIDVQEFKTYKSNMGSGFTELFALGEWAEGGGVKINYEYSWELYDGSLEKVLLPLSVWQDSTEAAVLLEKE